MSRKRSDRDVAVHPKMQRVMNALENITRRDASFVTSSVAHFPSPHILIQHPEECMLLHFPLRSTNLTCVLLGNKDTTVWSVDSAALEIQKSKWKTFLDDIVPDLRTPMGMAPTADITLTLNKLLLVETGGCIRVDHKDAEKRDSVIGTLLIVLRGEFSDGEFVVSTKYKSLQDKEDKEDSEHDEEDNEGTEGEEQEDADNEEVDEDHNKKEAPEKRAKDLAPNCARDSL